MRDYRVSNNFSQRKEMFSAVCSECGKKCEVPFKPTGNKPVYCNDCFRKQDGGYEKNALVESEMFTAHCDDCGKRCRVPFRPVAGKEVFCSDCFTKRGEKKSLGGDSAKLQSRLDIINSKLDKLLKLMERKTAKENKDTAVQPTTISEIIALEEKDNIE